MAVTSSSAPATPEPGISLDKITYVIELAREYDVKESDSDPDTGSNPTDDGDTDILEDKPGDATAEALADAIRGLNQDEQIRLVALAWLGRGTYDIEEWDEALRTAQGEHNARTAEYLMGLPLLGDYLEDGLALFGEGIVDDGDTREGLDDEDEPLGNMTTRRNTDRAGG